MAGKQIYEEIIYQINTLLKQGEFYPKYVESILGGKNDFKISQVYTKKNYSTDWIDTLEDCIISLDNIVRNPRKFIVIEEDIVDISLARSISVESVKHLSQHTNLISSVTKDGMVLPSKILNTSKEESFDIYENRFIYTLLLKIRDFIDRRFNVLKNALLQSGDLGVSIDSEFAIDKNKLSYKLDASASFPFDAVVKRSTGGQPTSIERVAHINSIINDFLSSPFSKEMRSCALVRPPIQRTNVILKNPDFKKALLLWQFIESNENLDFNVETVTESTELPPALGDKYRSLIYLNTILMQSIASSRTDEGSAIDFKDEDKEETADIYVTKNIDDYVPDDFPLLRLEVNEIRSVYQKIASAKTLTVTQMSKMNAAIDRVLRQFKINKAKEDSETQKRLIAKQAEEEALAKRLALREQQDLERIKRQEEARRRQEAKRIEAERVAELKRIVKERQELERQQKAEAERLEAERKRQEAQQKAEAERQKKIKLETSAETEKYRRVEQLALNRLDEAKENFRQAVEAFTAEQEALSDERRAHENAMAEEIAEEMAIKEEGLMLDRLAKEHDDGSERMYTEKEETLARLKQESEDYWRGERELAVRLGVEERLSVLNMHERAELDKILAAEKQNSDILKDINDAFKAGLNYDNIEHITALMNIARRFHTEDEVEKRVAAFLKERKRKQKARVIRKLTPKFLEKKKPFDGDGDNSPDLPDFTEKASDRFQRIKRGRK